MFLRWFRKKIAVEVEDKMCDLGTCPNERDIILNIIAPKDHKRERHCGTDCWNADCAWYYRNDCTVNAARAGQPAMQELRIQTAPSLQYAFASPKKEKIVPRAEPRNGLVRFECNGAEYAMTEAEIEAAYRYRESQFRKEDAIRQLNYFIFGYDKADLGGDPDNFSATELEEIAYFEEKYGISYAEAKKLADIYEAQFCAIFDCNVSENDLWYSAISIVLENRGALTL